MKLSELAERTGARIQGASDLDIVGAAGLDEATEGQVTFLANPRYTPRVNSTHASAIYLSEDAQTDRQIAILRVKDPYLAYTRALRIFNPEAEIEPFIHPSAVIDPTARLAKSVAIGACSVIGRNVFIGDEVRMSGTKIGEVSRMRLGPNFEAIVDLKIDSPVGLPTDTSAAIHTDGLFGSKHVVLVPGADETELKAGGRLDLTQDAVVVTDLLDLIIGEAKSNAAKRENELNKAKAAAQACFWPCRNPYARFRPSAPR